MKTTENLTAEESLALINQMIRQARNRFSYNSFFFLTWGWLMMFAGIGEYVLQMLLHSAYFFVVWPAAGLIGGVISILYGRKISSGSYVPNFTDRVISYTWSGFVITLVIMIVSLVIHEMNPGSFVMVLTGFPTFVTGMILRFRPLIAGGIVFWTIGVISFFYLPELRSLLFSLSIVLGYLAPGYLLRTAERRARNNTAQ